MNLKLLRGYFKFGPFHVQFKADLVFKHPFKSPL